MIEKIRLEDNNETYLIDVSEKEVVVVLCLSGSIKIKNKWDESVYATLNQYETWTLTTTNRDPVVQAIDTTGADFLLVRYFRA
jgi:maleate cis-trans isomerase